MSELTFNRKTGVFTWGATQYKATSGPHGKGALPLGQYSIRTRHVVANKNISSSYEDAATGNRWFIPLEPSFSTTRSGFGIHPDGNVPGTLGCIGFASTDANSFWKRWTATPLASRPTKLRVTE